MDEIRVKQTSNPGCLVQFLYFIFIGWWASQLWIALAWLAMLTIIGLPLGIAMMNKLPKVIALRDTESDVILDTQTGEIRASSAKQRNFFIRAIYFLLIGWWLTALWMEVAWFLCLIIIGMPAGFWMFDKVPALLTLRRQ